MPDYRRAQVPGSTYFLTPVTHDRRPLLGSEAAVGWLRDAVQRVRRRHPFEVDAAVVLPDHLHFVWTLPADDSNFSTRVALVKRWFGESYQGAKTGTQEPGASRLRRRERSVWQRRFWEHTIRDDRDLRMHMDYIHYNPVKHGLAACPHGWRWSSFHRSVRAGYYDRDWCCSCRHAARQPDFAAIMSTVGE